MDRRDLLIKVCAASAGSAFGRALAVSREPVIGGACEGCEWVFDGMPAKPSSTARIAPAGEPGEPLMIEGTVTNLRGSSVAGVIVYAYHTDRGGIYPPAGNRHGALRGWATTGARGQYRFDTIRPGAYPGMSIPQHVHMHVIEPGVGTYYIDELRFEDDPLITDRNRRGDERGGKGLMRPERQDGSWRVRRDIVLGRNIPGYPAR